ncbi:uncharacterized protein LOC122393854 [Amphibalanus amphitrite]|nr:uncharacterized protein LOC122393854 [Amphibalanus amphitrite]
MAVLDEFGYKNHVHFTTDHAANMISAFKEHDWDGCVCHAINLAVTKATKEDIRDCPIRTILDSTKRMVKFAKKSGLNKALSSAVKQSVPTRWNSDLIMLESVLAIYDELKDFRHRQEVDDFLMVVSPSEITDLTEVLSFFGSVSAQLESAKTPTGNLVPVVYQLAMRHLSPEAQDSRMKAAFKSVLLEAAQEKVSVSPWHLLCAALHPKYRTLKQFSFLQEPQRVAVRNAMTEAAAAEADAVRQQPRRRPQEAGPSRVLVQLELEDVDDPLPLEAVATPSDSKCRAAREVDRYMETHPGAVDDVLQFWRTHSNVYPMLSRVARRQLGAPAANTASERANSLAGRTLDERRARLSAECVDALLFIKQNRDLVSSNMGMATVVDLE